MALTPCERYQPFVVTAAGLGVEQPFGTFGSVYDFQGWKELAWKIIGILETNVGILQDVGGASQWPAVLEGLQADYKALPFIYEVFGFPTSPGSDDDDTLAARDLAAQAACDLGDLEDAIIAVGGTAEIPFKGKQAPKPEKTFQDTIGEATEKAGTGLFWLAVLWIYTRDKS